MKASSRFRIVHEHTEKEFWGRYKNHDVHVTREGPGKFYITVTDAGGYYSYDGYWPGSFESFLGPTMEAAIEQALIGSQLLKVK